MINFINKPKISKQKKCPRCGKLRMYVKKIYNNLSRRDNKTYICNECGTEEALIDNGRMEPTVLERNFVKKLK